MFNYLFLLLLPNPLYLSHFRFNAHIIFWLWITYLVLRRLFFLFKLKDLKEALLFSLVGLKISGIYLICSIMILSYYSLYSLHLFIHSFSIVSLHSHHFLHFILTFLPLHSFNQCFLRINSIYYYKIILNLFSFLLYFSKKCIHILR